MTFIMTKQILILGASISNHQHEMTERRLNIQDFRRQPFIATNIEEFAAAIGANIDSDLLPLTRSRPSDLEPGAHTGEMPTHNFTGSHITP
jgi:hypothetical protein